MSERRFQSQPHRPNDAKLRELILYISERLSSDPSFGDTKLNKVLFYSDFSAYLRLGKPITSHRYKKQVYGPIVHALLPFRQKMIDAKECAVTQTYDLNYKQRRTIPLREARLTGLFTPEEIALVDEMIERIRPLTAREISDISHDFLGWQIVDMDEEIPYEMAFLVHRNLTAEEESWAARLEPSIGE